MVVVLTEERQIVEVGLPAVAFPPPDVVRVDEDGVGTRREATVAVSPPELAALGGGRISSGPPLVHRVARLVVEGDDHRGVTRQAPGHLGVDKALVLELAGQLAVLCEGRQRHVGHDDVGARRRGLLVALGRAPGAHEGHEGVGEALVPADLTVGGELLGARFEARAHLGVGLGGELGAQRATRIVEAQRAALVGGVGRREGVGGQLGLGQL